MNRIFAKSFYLYCNELINSAKWSSLKTVIKLGGFLFPADLTHEKIEPYVSLIRKLHVDRHRIVVVAGGGATARKYIDAARALGADEASCDQLGIHVTRLNARLLLTLLRDDAYPIVPTDIETLKQSYSTGKVVVMGGLQPGHSTGAVAAIVAEAIGGDLLINVTDVDGIYTTDPHKDKSAKKMDQISITELMEMAVKQEIWAGEYRLIDPVGIKILERSRIPAYYISGGDPRNIERAIKGERVGTKVVF